MGNFSRRLNDVESFDHFFKAIKYSIDENLLGSFVDAELMTITEHEQTSSSRRNRLPAYATDESRWQLRTKIVEELLTLERLVDDEKINLGVGGAIPVGGARSQKKAFIIIGLPASGKSGIANRIADEYSAIILDSDYAKRKLPEFGGFKSGASLVHAESGGIVFPGKMTIDQPFETLSEKVIKLGMNFVYPTVGQDYVSLIKYADSLKNSAGYEVHLILVNLDRQKATHRAIERYIKTNRYVPLGLIFDCYSNEPTLNYYYAKQRESELFASFGEVSTDVPYGDGPKCANLTDDSPVNLFL